LDIFKKFAVSQVVTGVLCLIFGIAATVTALLGETTSVWIAYNSFRRHGMEKHHMAYPTYAEGIWGGIAIISIGFVGLVKEHFRVVKENNLYRLTFAASVLPLLACALACKVIHDLRSMGDTPGVYLGLVVAELIFCSVSLLLITTSAWKSYKLMREEDDLQTITD